MNRRRSGLNIREGSYPLQAHLCIGIYWLNLRWFCYDDEDVGDAIIHTKSLKWRSEQIIDYVEQIATKSVISVLEMDEAELALRVLTAEINLPK